jgi:hypothetical protein
MLRIRIRIIEQDLDPKLPLWKLIKDPTYCGIFGLIKNFFGNSNKYDLRRCTNTTTTPTLVMHQYKTELMNFIQAESRSGEVSKRKVGSATPPREPTVPPAVGNHWPEKCSK